MSKQIPTNQAVRTDSLAGDVGEKLRRSRQRLLDLTLRNRLLNFRPGHPNYRDDLKAHKHVVLKGHIESLWQALVEDEKHIEVVGLTRDQQTQLAQELRSQSNAQSNPNPGAGLTLATLGHSEWEDVRGSIRGVSQFLQKGNLLSLLPDEAFRKRLTKIRNEQNTLANSTGDSALFLAVGFLEWCEAEPHPRANEPLFAPLILIHVNLDQRRTEEGGEREFLLHMDADQPQGNPCLAEKLRQDFAIDLPDLDEDEAASTYFSRVSRALRTKKNWKVNPTIALGFFNFARYRLWLDLNPSEWPEGKSPTEHPIVSAILNGEPLPQQNGIPSDDEVANHQETADLPIVMDSDSTQYAALLAGQKGVSMVVQGPPGSGKSQTITNLIAVAMAQGKRVLFVAQKLPALQVVRRRLETVELAPFCLPLFSDKARVTEMHKHLAASARLRENPDWRRTVNNPVVALAKKLNDHAARLREQPTGFNQGACSLIQKATALHLMLREAWGDLWNDELLVVSVLDVEAPPDWHEKREQTLHQWHRLKTEVGNAWSNWTPLKLGPMDTQQVEAVNHLAKARQLLSEGANVQEEDDRHLDSPMGVAIWNDSIEMVQLLMEFGASPNDQEQIKPSSEGPYGGNTPLHDAVHKGSAKMVKLLLAHGADPDIQNAERLSPVELAKRRDQTHLVNLMEKQIDRSVIGESVEQLLTIGKVAELLSVEEAFVTKLLADGRLRHVKLDANITRIPASSLRKYIAKLLK